MATKGERLMYPVGGPIIDATAKLIAWPDSLLNSIDYATTAVIVIAVASGLRVVVEIVKLFLSRR